MPMWTYKSQIGLPLDPLFLSLGHSTLPYPHQLLKDETLGLFTAPFNLTPFNPYSVFTAFQLWHSSNGVNQSGVIHEQASLIYKDSQAMQHGYTTIYNPQPILVGDLIPHKKSYLPVLACTGSFNSHRRRWELIAVLAKPQASPLSLEVMPKPASLTELDYNYNQALFFALGKSLDVDTSLANGETTLASAMQDLASATKNYLDNVVRYLGSATAGAGTAGTTLIPPITSMSSLWDAVWQQNISTIQANTDQASQENEEALDVYQEAIDEVEKQEPKGYKQGVSPE